MDFQLLLLPISYQIFPMKPFRAMSTVEQLAAHLREEIRRGNFSGHMPGVAQLVRHLGVGTTTVVAALDILKREGMLESPGERQRSRIATADRRSKAGVRVRVLLYEQADAQSEYIMQLGHRIEQRGHHFTYAAKTMMELRFDVKRVARMVEKYDADAWVILAGSRPVLEWFSAQTIPAFALFGLQYRLPIASLATLKSPAVEKAVGRLAALGHQRIVMLVREERRKPALGILEQRFLESLERHGIATGPYNLPDWANDAQGLHRCLDSLFRHTPPTALLITEPALYFATQQYLLAKGMVVPRDVSLVSLDDHPAFAWFQPEVSYIRADIRRMLPRVVRWVDHVAMGKEDRRETLIRGEFVEGGTIGPAPK